ncbi:MAG: hypothetical protein H6739_28435 [Alphaproteobacteria bacterium]|nr:hypothetical protein [Alphaproteobacteria bacterium]
MSGGPPARPWRWRCPPRTCAACWTRASPAGPPLTGAWTFVHPALRESLLRAAREGPSWRALNRACADALAGRPERIEHRARLLIEADDPDAAEAALLQAAHACPEPAGAEALLALRDAVLTSLGLPQDDPRRLAR